MGIVYCFYMSFITYKNGNDDYVQTVYQEEDLPDTR